MPSALDGSDFAVAQAPRERLPSSSEGQLVGRFFVPAGTRIDGPAPFLSLTGVGGSILELTFNTNWELGAFTGASVLQPDPVSQPRSATRFDPGREYLLKASWRAGAFRRVLVDNATVFDDALMPASGAGARPTQLEMGILRYDGNGQNPLDVTLLDWAMCDNADATF